MTSHQTVPVTLNSPHSPTCQTIALGLTHCDCYRRRFCDCANCISRRAAALRPDDELARLDKAIEQVQNAELFEDGLAAELDGLTLAEAYVAGRKEVLTELRALYPTEAGLVRIKE